jgi:hypothetical protein
VTFAFLPTSTMQMERVCSFETLIPTYHIMWCHNLDGYNIKLHHCETEISSSL